MKIKFETSYPDSYDKQRAVKLERGVSREIESEYIGRKNVKERRFVNWGKGLGSWKVYFIVSDVSLGRDSRTLGLNLWITVNDSKLVNRESHFLDFVASKSRERTWNISQIRINLPFGSMKRSERKNEWMSEWMNK
jgi:hypothetical protein